MSAALNRRLLDKNETPVEIDSLSQVGKAAFPIQSKTAWMLQVATDHELTPAAAKIAAVLVFKYLNTKTGACFPSQETLASDVGLKVRQVKSLVKALADRGHLTILRGNKGHSNRYKMILWDRKEEPVSDTDTCKFTSSKVQDTAPSKGKNLHPNHRIEPLKEPSNGLKAVRNSSIINIKEEGGRDYAPPSNRSRLQTDMMVDVPNIGLCGVERLLRNNSVIIRSADDGEIYRCSLFEDGKINPASVEKLEVDDDR